MLCQKQKEEPRYNNYAKKHIVSLRNSIINIKFIQVIKKIYFYFTLSSFIIGQALIHSDKSGGLIITLGIFLPVMVSYINIELINWIHNNYGNQATNYFNIFQFLTKSMFMILMSYVGIEIFNLNFKIYIPVLCTVWFVFHIVEAFFTQNLLKRQK